MRLVFNDSKNWFIANAISLIHMSSLSTGINFDFILFLFNAFIVSNIGYLPQIAAKRTFSQAVQHFRGILNEQLCAVHAAGTYKNERIITSPQSTIIHIEGSSKGVVNFCANNYLGMSVSE